MISHARQQIITIHVLPDILSMIFQEKYFSYYILLTDLYFLSYIYILNIYIVITCCLVCEINLSILIKSFYYIIKKSEQKCKYLKNERAFNMKYKVFFIIFIGFLIEANKSNFFLTVRARL